MPVADVDNIHHFPQFRVCKDAVLYVLRATEGYQWVASCLCLPFCDGFQPETGKVQRTSVLRTDGVNHVRLVLGLVEAHADILSVQWLEDGVLLVIELLCHEDSLVAGKGNGLREVCPVDIVDGSPGAVYPVGTSLQDIMLEIMLVEE